MPLIVHGSTYEGYIKVKNRTYFIQARPSMCSQWDPKDVIVDWRLHSALNDSLYQFIEEQSKCTNFYEFFNKLEEFVKCNLKDQPEFETSIGNPTKFFNFYKCLEQELIEVEEYIKDINVEEGIIEIESRDPALRVHKAVIKLPENYPKESIKIVNIDLPSDGTNSSQKRLDFCSVNTIVGFCKKFNQYIQIFQDFWDSVSILDTSCWVLDPENPSYKDITRRIKISDKISVVLVFNPYMGRHRPEIKFLGCHSSVTEFREILQKNLENEIWDTELDILTNLMNVLEVTFPAKVEGNNEDNSLSLVKIGECAICFMIRLEDEIPCVICDNGNCMSHYHKTCLFKYLSSVPGNKSFFGRIQGECPNCDQVISCPVPNYS